MARLRVPVGTDPWRWRTFQSLRTLVVVARTVTSTVRVLEVLPDLLRGDDRVSVVFAYDPTSAFSDGVLDLLRDSGCRILPWEQLAEISPDLILSASENLDLPDGDCPVLVLPHGIGFQKLVPDSRSTRTRLSGVVPERLLKRTRLAISHPDQEAQLIEAHPEAAGCTELVGDPCYDRLIASLPQRAAYLRALRVEPGKRLVVVSSTWGPTSLIARDPELPARLLAELPLDEYRVAVVLHPNVWSAHGAWQIRALQSAALEAGLLIVPPTRGWQAAVVAASAVVGDHGSVTLYGASLGRPTMLATFGEDLVPGTAGAELGRTAPRLDPRAPLRTQLERAIDTNDPDRWAALAGRAFADPGQAMARLRSLVCELLDLAEPTGPTPVRAFPAPQTQRSAVTATSVSLHLGTVPDESSASRTLSMERYPAALARRVDEAPDEFRYLACDTDEPDPKLALNASVLIERTPLDAPSAAARIAEILATHPGSLLAAATLDITTLDTSTPDTTGGHLVGLRDGRLVEVSGARTGDHGVAAVYACLRADLPLDRSRWTVRTGTAPGPAQPLTLRLRVHADRSD
ncbi:hypothetical protein [Kitasatospora sp. MAP5-34]|uniref:hypothetical protein n=1 Tax=Kitasatospora sp. MAP5-34 TaxID=3035102 RepID=UPI002474F661|nr:hypothetical protein [Kitasatospora sp. MAP5-34]MDH6577703.1 hypothetical protein [Kitasatospora sp. MAP5-34]